MPTLLEALEQKYGESGTDSEGSEEDEGISVSIFLPRKPPRTLVPSLLVLNDCDIVSAGDEKALVDKCAAVEELDLAKNKLQDWLEVFGILKQMPRLTFVNLSFNELCQPMMEVELSECKWQRLRSLVLNSTRIPWDNTQRILDHLPSLEELHLSLNDYNHVNLHCHCNSDANGHTPVCSCPTEAYKKKHKHLSVKRVHFTGNPVGKWAEICKLGYAFPNLELLIVADCPLKSLDIDGTEDSKRSESECESGNHGESPHNSFRNLKVLNLNSTLISTWDDIERLSRFPALHCLRVQGCPLWESHEYTEHERRQFLVARLPNVDMLNGGGSIDSDEREDAERAFIRHYMEKPESERPDRYFELVGIHGKLDPLVNVDLRPEKRVKVTFTCGNNSEVRSVDVYRTVFDLKVKLERFAGFPAHKMRLFYVDQDLRDIQGPEEMKYPSKQLYSYNIRSGDEIIIDYKKKLDKH